MLMKQLAQLQHAFQEYVLHPGKHEASPWVNPDGQTEAETRLSAYASAYRVRLKEVLANDYHALSKAIGDEQFNQLADDYIEIETQLPEVLSPIPFVTPLQLFAYYMALERGNDPDKPRNLAKSVTVK